MFKQEVKLPDDQPPLLDAVVGVFNSNQNVAGKLQKDQSFALNKLLVKTPTMAAKTSAMGVDNPFIYSA
jgi:hypothetical protein